MPNDRSASILPHHSLPPYLDASARRYWIIFAVVYALDETLGFILNWIPLYHTVKTSFLVFTAYFGGAQLVYSRYLKPYLAQREAQIDHGIDYGKGWFRGKLKGVTNKATTAGQQYMNVGEDNNGMMNGLTGDLNQQI